MNKSATTGRALLQAKRKIESSPDTIELAAESNGYASSKDKNRATNRDTNLDVDVLAEPDMEPDLVLSDQSQWHSLDPRIKPFVTPGEIASESLKMVQAKISTKFEDCFPKIIMVTSPQPGDGKTTISTALSANLARTKKDRVLLIDCDLRKPSVHKIFGLHPDRGLWEYLNTETMDLGPFLIETLFDKLTFLPAGRPDVGGAEQLASKKMQQLIEQLKNNVKIKHIILDATPAPFFPEVSCLASIVDAVLLVVRAGHTSKEMINEAIENIGREKIAGIIFNASSDKIRKYGYYSRYYSGEKAAA